MHSGKQVLLQGVCNTHVLKAQSYQQKKLNVIKPYTTLASL